MDGCDKVRNGAKNDGMKMKHEPPVGGVIAAGREIFLERYKEFWELSGRMDVIDVYFGRSPQDTRLKCKGLKWSVLCGFLLT